MPFDYIKRYMGAPTGIDVDALRQENEDLKEARGTPVHHRRGEHAADAGRGGGDCARASSPWFCLELPSGARVGGGCGAPP